MGRITERLDGRAYLKFISALTIGMIAEMLAYYEDLEESGRLVILPEGDGKTVLLKALAYSDICPGDCGLKNPPECYDKECAGCWETALKGGSNDNR